VIKLTDGGGTCKNSDSQVSYKLGE